MMKSQRTCLLAGLILCLLGLGLPRVSYGVTGCTNAYLTGTYNAQVSSGNLMSVLNTLNGNTSTSSNSGSGGSTGSVGSGSTAPNNGFFGPGTPSTAPGTGGATGGGGTTGSVSTPGFSNNPFSLNGMLPSTSRFFFDGNGNIVGQNPNSGSGNLEVSAGTYNVNSDCSATIKLTTGQTFNAVVTSNGSQVLFLESDSGNAGVVGALQRSSNVCLNASSFPASFGFSFFGAQNSGASGTVAFAPVSAVGSIVLNNDSTFSLSEWIFQNGGVTSFKNGGSYTVAADCSLSLTFNSGGGTTGSVGSFTAPLLFRGALVNNRGGQLVIQPNSSTTVTGEFFAQ